MLCQLSAKPFFLLQKKDAPYKLEIELAFGCSIVANLLRFVCKLDECY